MTRMTGQYDANDELYFQLQADLEHYLLDEKNRASRRLTVYFPHTKRTVELEASAGLLREWVRHLQDRRGFSGDTEAAWDDYPEAMQAAELLVSLTGLIPGNDTDLSASTTSLLM